MIFYNQDDREINLLERKDYISRLGSLPNTITKEYEIPLNGMYLLAAINTYNVGGLFVLESGSLQEQIQITSIKQPGNYIHVSSEKNHSIKMQANGASYEVYLIRLFI